MAPLIIKVCGMTEAENIRNVEQLDVDMIGFIFYPTSPCARYRHIFRFAQSAWESSSMKVRKLS